MKKRAKSSLFVIFAALLNERDVFSIFFKKALALF